jgi:hypothetical protein
MALMKSLQEKSKEQLVNEAFNAFVSAYSDFNKEEEIKYGRDKRVPYIGWFWRTTDFVNKRISIGNCGSFIGVMENNKWDYPERDMTKQEADTFIAYIDRAHDESRNGGDLAAIQNNVNTVFNECWTWFQTLEV